MQSIDLKLNMPINERKKKNQMFAFVLYDDDDLN